MKRRPSDPPPAIVSVKAPADTPAAPPPGAAPDTAGAWTAHDPATRAFLASLHQAAAQDSPVYVYGEPGSGRRCAARTLCRWRRELRGESRTAADGQRAPVVTLRVPSLRERPLDLPEIAARCLAQLVREGGGPAHELTPRALEALRAREWRGNITELHSVLAAATRRASSRARLDADDLPTGSEPPLRPSQIAKDTAQRDCLLRQLRVARSISGAARLEGCSRANYIRLMRRLGIRRADCGETSAGERRED
jgi:DNA-binding NtrC family response regulator